MVVANIDVLSERLLAFNPRKKWYRRWIQRSAVALILRQVEGGVEALMIKRADREGDRWSGHMAFPGGRAEEADSDSLHTARRETWEEVGLDTDNHTRFVGRLSDVLARPKLGRKPMVITPYLFVVDEVPELAPNQEVAEVVWVPLHFLADQRNRELMQWRGSFRPRNVPCYFYQGRCIWGLSLRMLDELLSAIKP